MSFSQHFKLHFHKKFFNRFIFMYYVMISVTRASKDFYTEAGTKCPGVDVLKIADVI